MEFEKNLTIIFIDETSFTKIYNLSENMGCTYGGLVQDYKDLLQKTRK